MARMWAVIIVIMYMCSEAYGQTLGFRIGTLYNDGNLVTQRLEASFTNPIMQDVEVTVSTGVLTALAERNSGYAVPLLGGIKYTFLQNTYAPYCGLEYGGVLNVRRNNHSRMSSAYRAGLGIQYPLKDRLSLDFSTKLVMQDYSAYEFMAGLRFRL